MAEPKNQHGETTIILNRAEVLRLLRTCDIVDDLHEKVLCPETGVMKQLGDVVQKVSSLEQKETARKEAEAKRDAWMLAVFGGAASALLVSIVAFLKGLGKG